MNNDAIVIIGLVLYLLGTVRTYRWMRKQLESKTVENFVGKPGKIGTFIAAFLGWYMIEAALLLWWHDQSCAEGFEKNYMVCPDCQGKPLITNYRALWDSAKPPFRCPRCKGTGIVRRDDQVDK